MIDFAKEKCGGVKYVINTESHIDHVFGNPYLKKEGATIISHEKMVDGYYKIPPAFNQTTYEACKEINPKIIYASLKGFAQDGPYKDYPAFDPIATHTGVMVSATGLPDQPIKCGISVADSGTGITLAMSIIAALLQREREGIG